MLSYRVHVKFPDDSPKFVKAKKNGRDGRWIEPILNEKTGRIVVVSAGATELADSNNILKVVFRVKCADKDVLVSFGNQTEINDGTTRIRYVGAMFKARNHAAE